VQKNEVIVAKADKVRKVRKCAQSWESMKECAKFWKKVWKRGKS